VRFLRRDRQVLHPRVRDPSTFIDETLALRIDDDALHVGDPHVVLEVREALLSGAKCM
jgi:hypothetical protein